MKRKIGGKHHILLRYWQLQVALDSFDAQYTREIKSKESDICHLSLSGETSKH